MVMSSTLGTCFKRPPAYPSDALRKELTGRTLLVFSVSPEGKIQSPGLLRSSGHPALDQAALAHLSMCIAMQEGQSPPPLPPGRYALPHVWRIE